MSFHTIMQAMEIWLQIIEWSRDRRLVGYWYDIQMTGGQEECGIAKRVKISANERGDNRWGVVYGCSSSVMDGAHQSLCRPTLPLYLIIVDWITDQPWLVMTTHDVIAVESRHTRHHSYILFSPKQKKRHRGIPSLIIFIHLQTVIRKNT